MKGLYLLLLGRLAVPGLCASALHIEFSFFWLVRVGDLRGYRARYDLGLQQVLLKRPSSGVLEALWRAARVPERLRASRRRRGEAAPQVAEEAPKGINSIIIILAIYVLLLLLFLFFFFLLFEIFYDD